MIKRNKLLLALFITVAGCSAAPEDESILNDNSRNLTATSSIELRMKNLERKLSQLEVHLNEVTDEQAKFPEILSDIDELIRSNADLENQINQMELAALDCGQPVNDSAARETRFTCGGVEVIVPWGQNGANGEDGEDANCQVVRHEPENRASISCNGGAPVNVYDGEDFQVGDTEYLIASDAERKKLMGPGDSEPVLSNNEFIHTHSLSSRRPALYFGNVHLLAQGPLQTNSNGDALGDGVWAHLYHIDVNGNETLIQRFFVGLFTALPWQASESRQSFVVPLKDGEQLKIKAYGCNPEGPAGPCDEEYAAAWVTSLAFRVMSN